MSTVEPKPRRRRWVSAFILLGSATLACSLLGAAWALRSHGAAPPTAPAGATPAESSSEGVKIVASCLGFVDVDGGLTYPYPISPGRVVQVAVQEGQSVKASDVLFRMDDTVARADLERAEAGLKAARAKVDEAKNGLARHAVLMAAQAQGVEAAKHELAAARFAAQRRRELVGTGVSKVEASAAEELALKAQAGVEAEEKKLEEVKLQAKDIQAKIVQAEQDVADKTALKTKAQYALDECAVTARKDGEILRLALQPGDLLGADPKMPPVIFCPAGPRIIRAEVEQEFAGRVAVGQIAYIRDEARVSSAVWTGKVSRLADWMAHRRSVLPDPSQMLDVRTLEARITLDPNQPPLRIGQRVRVEIHNP